MSKSGISQETTYIPDPKDRERYAEIKRALQIENQEIEEHERFDQIVREEDMPRLQISDTESYPLTKNLAKILLDVTGKMAKNMPVILIPADRQLTTQESADLLGISRPTFVKILESGGIPFSTVGRHRRVMLSDLLSYKKKRHEQAMRAFRDLSGEEDPHKTEDNPLIHRS